MRRVAAAAPPGRAREARLDRLDRGERPRQHREPGPVDRGERHLGVGQGERRPRSGSGTASIAPGGIAASAGRARRPAQGVVEREHARRGTPPTYSPRLWPIIAGGLDAAAHPQRASAYSTTNSAGWVTLVSFSRAAAASRVLREEEVRRSRPRIGSTTAAARSTSARKPGSSAYRSRRHAGVLRALAAEHEHGAARGRVGRAAGARCRRGPASSRRASAWSRATTTRCGMGTRPACSVNATSASGGQVVARQVVGEAALRRVERGRGPRREDEELPRARRTARLRLRRLLEDRVGVGAADAERAHAGAARAAVPGPRRERGVDAERACARNRSPGSAS